MELFNFNKSKEYRNAKNIANKVNKLLSNSKFLNDLISSNDPNNISFEISKIIKYYIFTNDKKCNYTYEEFEEVYDSDDTYKLFQEFNNEEYRKNMILANSSNGYSKNNILKNGFKNIIFDKKLEEELEYVENKLGKSDFIENQNKDNSQEDEYLFFTTPGSLVVEYSMKLSPERLYLGILKGIKSTPYILGEGKINYCKRIIEKNIKENNLENDEKINVYIDDILEKLCSKKPIINLFPEKTKNNQIKAHIGSISNEYNSENVSELVFDNFTEGYADFEYGGSEGVNSANLVTTNTNLSKKDIGIIDIPDWFECLEISARSKGYQNGEMIDVNTFEKFELDLSYMEDIYLGGTGQMFLCEKDNKEYLFKASESKYEHEKQPYRRIVQECAYKVQNTEKDIQNSDYLPKTYNVSSTKDSDDIVIFDTQKIGKATIGTPIENKNKATNIVVNRMNQKNREDKIKA